MLRRRRLIRAASLSAIVCLVVVAVPGSVTATLRSRTCAAPKYPGSGYFTSLTVSGVSCATGRKVTLAYYRCRIRHGVKGRCTSRVLGYTCRETRYSIPTEFDARVICRQPGKKVVHTYQQFT
jgi:hypothetical protein